MLKPALITANNGHTCWTNRACYEIITRRLTQTSSGYLFVVFERRDAGRARLRVAVTERFAALNTKLEIIVQCEASFALFLLSQVHADCVR